MKAKFVNEVLNYNRSLFEKMKSIFLDVKQSNTYDPFYELNQRLNPLHIFLTDFKTYMNSIDEKERRAFSNSMVIPKLDIRILAFDSDSENILIMVGESFDDAFIEMSKKELIQILDYLWIAFGHETIHLEQVKRMNIKQDPKFKSRDQYFRNKQEMMALAFSCIEELKHIGLSKEKILNLFRNKPEVYHRVPILYKIYKDLGDKEFKRFSKYVYQYLTKDDVNETFYLKNAKK